ncbi:MAG: type I 3-dehydroquinate dehydratase [Betaproteobacteria bacterium]|nr:type I 3-dehydroquinate dehydratase [Betaproteobacteria bacterium]
MLTLNRSLAGPAPARRPLICVSLQGADADALVAEAAVVLPQRPDVIEWRADAFAGLADAAQVGVAARRLRQAVQGTPILFTRRSVAEGGMANVAGEPQVLAAYDAVLQGGWVDAIDVELSQADDTIRALRAQSRAAGVTAILSFHDFNATPPNADLIARAERAVAFGADAVKLATMPGSAADVLRLLEVTREIAGRGQVAVISMAMGALGRWSRMAGGLLGSAMTFAAGLQASAPGQPDIATLRAALDALHAD